MNRIKWTEDKLSQEQDWLDRFVDKIGSWLDSLTEKNETQNLGNWSKPSQEERQGKKEATGN